METSIESLIARRSLVTMFLSNFIVIAKELSLKTRLTIDILARGIDMICTIQRLRQNDLSQIREAKKRAHKIGLFFVLYNLLMVQSNLPTSTDQRGPNLVIFGVAIFVTGLILSSLSFGLVLGLPLNIVGAVLYLTGMIITFPKRNLSKFAKRTFIFGLLALIIPLASAILVMRNMDSNNRAAEEACSMYDKSSAWYSNCLYLKGKE